jgi:hypothetical protein
MMEELVVSLGLHPGRPSYLFGCPFIHLTGRTARRTRPASYDLTQQHRHQRTCDWWVHLGVWFHELNFSSYYIEYIEIFITN